MEPLITAEVTARQWKRQLVSTIEMAGLLFLCIMCIVADHLKRVCCFIVMLCIIDLKFAILENAILSNDCGIH